jgi:signal transduction histidine kinase
LKTPITSLKVYLQLLNRYATEEKSHQFYAKVNQQVDKLTFLIQDLLDVSRLQNGRLKLRKEVFNLAAVVEDTVENIRQTEARHTISVAGNISKMIEGDKERIGQVITNLLTNAIKYSPEANRILVTLAENQHYATVKVQDFGIGIEKKYLNKIFQRFYRIEEKNKKTFPGLGIGLFISQQIIKQHGGFIEVTSEPEKGSVFSFSLPLHYASHKIGKREANFFIASRK